MGGGPGLGTDAEDEGLGRCPGRGGAEKAAGNCEGLTGWDTVGWG